MSWRETLGVSHPADSLSTHNTQKTSESRNSADNEDSAYRDLPAGVACRSPAALPKTLKQPAGPVVPLDHLDLPYQPCPTCSGVHFWQSAEGWRCSGCHPLPAGFQGETITLPGGKPSAASGTARADLLRLHPPTVAGVPLGAVLDQADPSDFDDLRDRALLEAFTAALPASGTINPARHQPAPQPPTAVPARPLGTGIGQCQAGRQPRDPEPPCYPNAPRLCGEFQPAEGNLLFHGKKFDFSIMVENLSDHMIEPAMPLALEKPDHD